MQHSGYTETGMQYEQPDSIEGKEKSKESSESTEFTRKEKRELSQEAHSYQRDALAEEVQEARKEAQERLQQIDEQIESLNTQIENHKKSIQEKAKMRQASKERLAEIESSVTKQVWQYSKLAKLEQAIQNNEHEALKLHAKIMDKQAAITSLQERRSEIKEATYEEQTQKIKDFYDQQSEYLKIESQRESVSEISEEFDVTFIHGVWTNQSMGSSILNSNASFRDRLAMVQALRPAVSASSIKEGDSGRNIWGSAGVILGAGDIAYGSPSDAGTGATNIDTREVRGRNRRRLYNKGVKGTVEDAIENRDDDEHNEFVIEEATPAGYFISFDYPESEHFDRLSKKGMYDQMKSLGLPVYAVRDGKIFELQKEDAELEIGAEISREEVMERSSNEEVLSGEERQELTQELLDKGILRPQSRECNFYEDRAAGQELYIKLHDNMKIDGSVDVQYLGERREFYRGEQGNRRVKINDAQDQRDELAWTRTPSEYISLGNGTWQLPLEVNDVDSYLKAVKEEIERIQDEPNSEHDFVLERLGYHLRGFGEMAEQMGDIKAQNKAVRIAEMVLDNQEYSDFKDNKIKEDGSYNLSIDEMKDSASE